MGAQCTSGLGVDAERISSRRYRAALVPHIAGRTPILSPAVRRVAEEAERELARFDAEQGAQVAAFAPVLLRSEAASSSQIENLTASARAIFSAELGARRRNPCCARGGSPETWRCPSRPGCWPTSRGITPV